MIDDATLLERYARDRSEEAFGELVQRHLALVYSAALRRTEGDAHWARDVAQIVFTALARDAVALSRHTALTSWLYAATRNAAINLMRAERRRGQREEKARIMDEILSSNETPADWERLRPVLDEAMDELDEHEREAVLLRFFESRPFASIATALRVSEDAARKRVDRALEKLGTLLKRRGITSTGGALALLLANQTAVAVPVDMAASVTAIAVAGAAGGAGLAGAAGVFIMSTSKIVTGITAVVALVAIGMAVHQAKISRDSETAAIAVSTERDQLRTRLGAMEQRVQQADSALVAAQKAVPQPAEAPVPRPGSTQSSALDYVFEHPETHAAFVEQHVLRTKARYDRFFKTSGLSAEKQEQLLNAVREHQASYLELMAALYKQGYSLENMPKDQGAVAKLLLGMQQRLDTGGRAALGDDGYKAMQQFFPEILRWNVADQVASQLYDTKEPLTGPQAEQLVGILKESRHRPEAASEPGNRVNGVVITRQARVARMVQESAAGMSTVEQQEPITDAAIARAQAVLTPPQLAVLKQVQARQALEFQVAPPPAFGPKPVADGK